MTDRNVGNKPRHEGRLYSEDSRAAGGPSRRHVTTSRKRSFVDVQVKRRLSLEVKGWEDNRG